MISFWAKKLPTGLAVLSVYLCSISSFALASTSAILKVAFANKLGSPAKKSPIITATGGLSFAVNDILFEGNTPLLFQRFYSSNNNEDIGLGKGWNFSFNDKIEADVFEAGLTTSRGEKFEYYGEGLRIDKNGNSEKFFLKTIEPEVTQSFTVINQSIIKATNSLAEKTYEKFGQAFYLTNIKFPNNDEVLLERFKDGRLSKISNHIGQIKLNWSGGKNPHLLSLIDSANRRVKFVQNYSQLKEVKSILNGNWKYNYIDGKLNKIVDPIGRVRLNVSYDKSGRAIISGDFIKPNTFGNEDATRFSTSHHPF